MDKITFCEEIKRRGEIDYKKVPKGYLKDRWARQRVRPITTLIYRGRFPLFTVFIHDIQKINPPTTLQVQFKNQKGKYVEEADERALSWLDALPYANRIDTEEITITYAEIVDNQKLVAQFKNTGTKPVRPIVPIYIDGEHVLSKQPIGINKLGLMDDTSISYHFRNLPKGEHTVKIKGYPGTDERTLEFYFEERH